jgi:cobalt/nickel transport system permease protein
MHLIDCFAHTNRWRKRHPAEKAGLALGLLALVLALPWPGSVAALVVATASALLGARIPWRVWTKVMAIPLVFLLLSGALLAVGLEHTPDGLRIVSSESRLHPALIVMNRAFAAAACLNLLALTTPAHEWVPLLRRCRVPAVVLDLMLVVYRMLFVLVERLSVMQTAQAARLGYVSRSNRMRSYGFLGACLLTRAMERAGRMEACLAARGGSGEFPMLPCSREPSRRFVVFVGFVLLGVLGVGLLGRYFGYV